MPLGDLWGSHTLNFNNNEVMAFPKDMMNMPSLLLLTSSTLMPSGCLHEQIIIVLFTMRLVSFVITPFAARITVLHEPVLIRSVAIFPLPLQSNSCAAGTTCYLEVCLYSPT